VKLFLENKANVNGANDGGWTPLQLAARHGRIEVVRLLLEKGANVNARDAGGVTPLHEAAGPAGPVAVVRLLLEKEANVYAQDDDGKTPLDLAVVCGKPDVVRLLLETGANPEAKNRQRLCQLEVAAEKHASFQDGFHRERLAEVVHILEEWRSSHS
jgi:ankyrin repeat protein